MTFDDLKYFIESDGLEYTVRDYSDWMTLQDPKLDELIYQFKFAADQLEEYINNHA